MDLSHAPQPRALGAVNWRGVWTLYAKEVRRFLKVIGQTLVAPMVTTLLFLAIFTLAIGQRFKIVEGVDFDQFLVPGLAMMAIIQNSFANTSSSLLISKVQGNIVDVLMPPLTSTELTFCFAMASLTRGVMVGIATVAAMSVFVAVPVHDWAAILFFGLGAAMMLSLLGLMGGIWADKFDHIAAVTNFVIMPLSVLSGSFYSISRLPEDWQFIAHFNPFFYMIDGFRYGFIGHADSEIWIGVVVVALFNTALWAAAYWMFRTGYKLKA